MGGCRVRVGSSPREASAWTWGRDSAAIACGRFIRAFEVGSNPCGRSQRRNRRDSLQTNTPPVSLHRQLSKDASFTSARIAGRDAAWVVTNADNDQTSHLVRPDLASGQAALWLTAPGLQLIGVDGQGHQH